MVYANLWNREKQKTIIRHTYSDLKEVALLNIIANITLFHIRYHLMNAINSTNIRKLGLKAMVAF